MLKHLLTLIWNRKRRNILLLTELVISFFILFAVLSFVLFNMDKFKTPLGFDTENIWIANLSAPPEIDSTAMVDIKSALLRKVGEIQEIEEVCFGNTVVPLSNSTWTSTTDENGFELTADMAKGDLNYEKTFGLNLVEGRWFNEDDLLQKHQPIVINKLMRDTYWKDTAVIGSTVLWAGGTKKIVGVMDHFKYHGEFDPEVNVIMEALPPYNFDTPNLAMRLKNGTSPEIEIEINNAIRQVAKGWGFSIESLETRRKRNSGKYWVPIVALVFVCGFLIFNVSLGLFGVLVYNIKKRKAEIGLRRAIGATPNGVSLQFILEILLLTSISIIVAIFFAIQLPLMNVFDIEPSIYIRAIVFSALIIYSLVLICTIYPSKQASLVNPATALHEE